MKTAAEYITIRDATNVAMSKAKPGNYVKMEKRNLKNYLDSLGIYERYHRVDISRMPRAQVIKNYCDNIEENVRLGQGLLILGPVGAGKSHILSYIAQQVFNYNISLPTAHFSDDGNILPIRQITLAYANSNSMFDDFFLNDSRKEEKAKRIDDYYKSKLLLIDDFGTEYNTNFSFTKFGNLIEYRYAKKLATVITSNFTASRLREQKNIARIVDRWREMCFTVNITNQGSQRKNINLGV